MERFPLAAVTAVSLCAAVGAILLRDGDRAGPRDRGSRAETSSPKDPVATAAPPIDPPAADPGPSELPPADPPPILLEEIPAEPEDFALPEEESVPDPDWQSRLLDKRAEHRLRLLAIPEWKEFYEAACLSPLLWVDDLQDLIVVRVARELGLEEGQESALRDLLLDEQETTSADAIALFGTKENLHRAGRVAGTQGGAYIAELKELRRRIRQEFQESWASAFTAEQRAVIDRHLRNDRISITYASKDGSVRVTGVGE